MILTTYDIARVLHARAQLQMWHWQARAYELHTALGALYGRLDDIGDSLVETVSQLERPPGAGALPSIEDLESPEQVMTYLGQLVGWLRDDLLKRVPPAEQGVANIAQDMLGAVQHGIYMISLQ